MLRLFLNTKLPVFFIITCFIGASCTSSSSREGTNKDETEGKTALLELIGETELVRIPDSVARKNEKEPKRTDFILPKEKNFKSGSVPVHIESKVPDFSKYQDSKEKKKAFFDFLRPVVKQENKRILKERAWVLQKLRNWRKNNSLPEDTLKKLKEMASRYRCSNRDFQNDSAAFRELLVHVDVIPMRLALIQAANESAWGTSFFAQRGNNLFGEWCFKKGCGIVPRRRSEGANHEVEVFEDVSGSVRSYLRNLNSHPAYRQLRVIRYESRVKGEEPTARDMALGLQKYSGIGMEYVNILRNMMEKNEELMAESSDMAVK